MSNPETLEQLAAANRTASHATRTMPAGNRSRDEGPGTWMARGFMLAFGASPVLILSILLANYVDRKLVMKDVEEVSREMQSIIDSIQR